MKKRPTSPGEMIREIYLDPNVEGHYTQQDVADRLGISRQRFNEILNGKRAITIDTAMRLERVLGPKAEFWMKLQAAVDLHEAERGPLGKEIARLKPIKGTA